MQQLVGGLVEIIRKSNIIRSEAALPEEAIEARDAIAAWIKPRNIHVWHRTAELESSVWLYRSPSTQRVGASASPACSLISRYPRAL